MAATQPTNTRLKVEFAVSLVLLAFVAALPAVVTNAYWQGVVVVSMYFALLAIATMIALGLPAAWGQVAAIAFGGAIGAPVIRNNLLFFGNYEGFRRSQARTQLATVPTVEMRTGNFSNVRDIFDPTQHIDTLKVKARDFR